MPFQPFDLAPGEDRWIAVTAHAPGCRSEPRAAKAITAVDVRYEVFGLERTAKLHFGSAMDRALILAPECSFIRSESAEPPAR